MGYVIDLCKITLDDYKNKLKNKTLIPSRMILKNNIEKYFWVFKEIGIKTADELFSLLKERS